MNLNVVAYLQENKNKYSKESLVDQLQKNGYPEKDIEDGINFVYGSTDQIYGPEKPGNFWNFNAKKNYTKSSEKWLDFLFGTFVPSLIVIVTNFIPILGILVALILIIFFLGYLFNRRKFIFFGMLAGLIAFPFLFGSFLNMYFNLYHTNF